VDIYQMIKKNFFLTDLMKTGYHQKIDEFLSMADITGEKIESTGEYYTLHQYDLTKYDRLFAMIDHQIFHYVYWQNKNYKKDIAHRISQLKEMGFKFIVTFPWESLENMSSHEEYKLLLEGIDYKIWHGSTNWFWFLLYKLHKNKQYNFNHNKKLYDFLYLNRQSRKHRKRLFEEMLNGGALDNSIYSFLDDPYRISLPEQYELPWVGKGKFPRYGGEQEIYEPQFNDTTFNLVSETNDNNNDIFMTEKIWKPIIAEQIFVVHGNYQFLKTLRNMGFKTFENYFDEGYDNELDPEKRIQKIFGLCKKLKTLDQQKIYKETEFIRQHNKNWFFNKEVLVKSINETVLGFLKFADRS